VRASLIAASISLVAVTAGCAGGGISAVPSSDTGVRQTQAKGAPGGGGGGGAAAPAPTPTPASGTVPFPQIPPPMTTDAAAWFFYITSDLRANTQLPLTINFDTQPGTSGVGQPIGSSRSGSLVVYNTSKKTPLTISSISVVGANPSDFVLDPASVAAAQSAPLAANKDTAVPINVRFVPTAEGVRTASIQFVSNAGTQLIALTGTALPNRPILAGIGPVSLLPTSAPAIEEITNTGGLTLEVDSMTLTGPNAGSFVLLPTQRGLGVCNANGPLAPGAGPLLLGAHQFCDFEVGLAPGATAPASAFLTIVSNDPTRPVASIPITLSSF
jgi:hypothetical protein